MRRLILLRHAKAALANLRQPDSDRPLNERGQREAQALGKIFQALDLAPDRILCSTARRTRQTWEGLAAGLAHPPPMPHYRQTLYLADPERLLNVLREEGGSSRTLLVLGHNDGLQEFVLKLAGAASPTALYDRASQKFPPAAMAVFACDIESWDRLAWHRNELLHLYYPGDEAKG